MAQTSDPDPQSSKASDTIKHLGNFSAVDPAYSREMECKDCKVRWTGCWDNFQCPQCGEGELPTHWTTQGLMFGGEGGDL